MMARATNESAPGVPSRGTVFKTVPRDALRARTRRVGGSQVFASSLRMTASGSRTDFFSARGSFDYFLQIKDFKRSHILPA
jgi:hypothetical protein